MITSLDQLDLKKRYSYADYLKWRFDEYVELIQGKIFKMSPAPSRRHQRISSNILTQFLRTFDSKSCQVYHAPFDVRLVNNKKSTSDEKIFTVVQPDICVICDPSKLDDRGCLGAPDLIVEILSPATRQKDLNEKYQLYEAAGVREYWIVQPGDATIAAFYLENGKYHLRKIYGAEEQLTPHIFPDFVLDLPGVFEP